MLFELQRYNPSACIQYLPTYSPELNPVRPFAFAHALPCCTDANMLAWGRAACHKSLCVLSLQPRQHGNRWHRAVLLQSHSFPY